MNKPAILVLENGTIFRGSSIGIDGTTIGEVVFNTAMSGYQEILTDPSYTGQIINFTYPHIGNVGVNVEDEESDRIWAKGLIVRELSSIESNWRSRGSLSQYLMQHQIVGIAEIDTRSLTVILREQGALSGCIMAGVCDEKLAFNYAKNFEGLAGKDLTPVVTTSVPYQWPAVSKQSSSPSKLKKSAEFHVVVYDFGVKKNILHCLVNAGCRLTVVPALTTYEELLSLEPDGVLLSNGPGDPKASHVIIQNIKKMLDSKIPLFGICLGHQLLALALGANTVKMKFGHHGANHPVQDLLNNQVMITSQNHGFMVDEQTLPHSVIPSHRSLFDGSLQGFRHLQKPIYGFQGHPEASPGPNEAIVLFNPFIEAMKSFRHTHTRSTVYAKAL